jgi:glycosyltransferase involved in cell wall biosynthesis
MRQLPAVRSLYRLISTGRRRDPSAILHVHMSKGFSHVREGLFALVGRLLGWRVVITWHSSRGLTAGGYLSRSLLRLSLLPAHVVTVLSTDHADVLPPVRASVVVVPNDVEVPTHIAPMTDRSPRVVFAGEFSRRKGGDVLLAAWDALRPEFGRTWTLEIYGRIAPELESLAARASEAGAVRLHGVTPSVRVLHELDDASVAVLPSRAEALPMFLLEAMAAGCAVVATAVGAVPDLLRAGAGVLVEPADGGALTSALRSLLSSAARREELGHAARRRVIEEHGSERGTATWEAVYSRAMADERGGAGRESKRRGGGPGTRPTLAWPATQGPSTGGVMRKRLAAAVSRNSRRAKVEWLRQRIKPGSRVLIVGANTKAQGTGRLGAGNIVERGLGEFTDIHALVYGEDGNTGLDCPTTQGDARELPFPDKSFDYVVSNAVIEHVGGPAGARRMLSESRRVARHGAFHTTPDRWFPIETHTQIPLLHWLPHSWQPTFFRRLARRDWNTDNCWLYGRGEFSRLDPAFTVERASFLTLVAAWQAAPEEGVTGVAQAT